MYVFFCRWNLGSYFVIIERVVEVTFKDSRFFAFLWKIVQLL